MPVHAARLLFEAAAQEDAVALEILHRQGVELGKSATAVIRRLGMELDTFDVVVAGSLLTRGDRGWIRESIEEAVHAAAPQASVVTLATEPVVGAVWSAMDQDGVVLSDEAYERMRSYQDYESIIK